MAIIFIGISIVPISFMIGSKLESVSARASSLNIVTLYQVKNRNIYIHVIVNTNINKLKTLGYATLGIATAQETSKDGISFYDKSSGLEKRLFIYHGNKRFVFLLITIIN